MSNAFDLVYAGGGFAYVGAMQDSVSAASAPAVPMPRSRSSTD